MKRISIGICLILCAIVYCFQDYLHDMTVGLPPLSFLGLIIFILLALKDILKKKWIGAVFFSGLSFMIINSSYHMIGISNWKLFFGLVLLVIGLSIIFPSHSAIRVSDGMFSKGISSNDGEFVFGERTLYLRMEDLLNEADYKSVFTKLDLDFNQVISTEQEIEINLESVFSAVTLHVPSDWSVRVNTESVFSQVKSPRQTSHVTNTLKVQGELVFSQLNVVYDGELEEIIDESNLEK